ncbi:MAG: sigma-70 family RNA polymerase sigma factor [Clostridiales bacterium]|nr:sigma-70 family RNA polymerase sigma factor [Clostridiales bacterium]
MKVLDYNYLASLVRKAQSGDSNAFAELYVATYQQQYRYAYKYLKDEHLAQDAIQETYIHALRSITKLQNPQLFIAWLNRINFRTCFDLMRKPDKSRTDVVLGDRAEEVRSESDHTENEVIEIDSRRYILKQVLNLPLTESQVILMKYYQGMSNDDIAAVMNISRSTVKRNLKSGKERLARLLSEFRV